MPEDYGALCLCCHATLRPCTPTSDAFSEAEAREWRKRQFDRYAEYGFGLWAVILKGRRASFIGQCGLNDGGRRELRAVCSRWAISSAGAFSTGAMPLRPPGPARTCLRLKAGDKEVFLDHGVTETTPPSMVAQRQQRLLAGSSQSTIINMDMPHTLYSRAYCAERRKCDKLMGFLSRGGLWSDRYENPALHALCFGADAADILPDYKFTTWQLWLSLAENR